ncbi:hypothetical protein [Neisseria uirgultaei]|uniref:hypothetical protein n=1 Tax=Neisseria uirgultaei TaxID=2830646 RepID=UPI00272D7356|nr:hypothetical protein [Neisseria uirgultaei]
MPSEALSDGIFYCLCRFVSGWQCRRRGIVMPPFEFSDGIIPPPSFPPRTVGQWQFLKIIKTRHSHAGGNPDHWTAAIFKSRLKI